MSQGWKITVMVVGVAGAVPTPLVWLLDSPDTGQLVGAQVQAATGIAALVWALLQRPPAPAPALAPALVPGPVDSVVDTGKADGTEGGTAHTGVRRPGGAGTGSAKAERTGAATARGPGSRAGTGIDYSCPRIPHALHERETLFCHEVLEAPLNTRPRCDQP